MPNSQATSHLFNDSRTLISEVTVLIIEDNENDRAIYQRILQADKSNSYKIFEANNIKDGLKLWRSHNPDIVLLDYVFSDGTGIEFLEGVTEGIADVKIPAIMITASENRLIATNAIKLGATDFLIKDKITFDILLRRIHHLLENFALSRILRRSQQQELLIAEISQRVRQTLDIQKIYSEIVQNVKSFLNADRTIIYKFNPNMSGTIVAESVTPPWIQSLHANVVDTCFRDDLGGAYQQGRIMATNDIHQAGLSACHIQLLERFQVKANLVVPILLPNPSNHPNDSKNISPPSLWGLLIVHQCSTTRNWDNVDERLIQQLSMQLAIAIQQAEIYQNIQTLNLSLEEKVQQRTAELQESERKLLAIFNNTFQLTGLLSVEGTLLELNQTGLDFSGLKREQVVNLPFWDLGWWSASEVNQIKIKQAIAIASKGESIRYEVDICGVNERLATIDFSLRPLKDESNNVILLILEGNDISERKQNEAKLASAALAEAANKAKTEFLATMSHEIRTPMNAVIGMTGLLINTPLSAQQQQFVSIIRQGGEVLLSVINKILDLSKIEAGNLMLEQHPFDLHQCIEETLDLMSSQSVKKALELSVLINLNVPRIIIGDSTCLRQVLVNLIGNAIKFTESGEITLNISAILTESVGSNIYQLNFTLCDTGIGISPEGITRLFQAFSQADSSITRQYGGTGLGLVICKQLCKLMGGDIHVESKVGQGTTFSFSIVAEEIASEEIAIATDLKHKKILVVTPIFTVQQIILLYAQSWGMEVKLASCEIEALDYLEKSEFDAVLIDSKLVSMSGLELTKNIQDVFPSLPIIFLVSPEYTVVASYPDFAGYLTKPIASSKLYQIFLQAFKISSLQKVTPLHPLHPDHRFASRYPFEILIVEDNPVNQQVLLLMLERLGYNGDTAGNGLEAFQALQRQSYDLIFMDIQMPIMDGLTACQNIRQLSGRNPWIIGLSANAFRESREIALAAGMNDYLAKPLRFEELFANLKKVSVDLQKDSYLNMNQIIEPEELILAKNKMTAQNSDRLINSSQPPSNDVKMTPVSNNIYSQLNFSINNLEVISPLTLNMLMDCLGEEDLSEIIKSFLQESDMTIYNMCQALEKLDFETISFENHSFRGGCATLGADRLTSISTQLSRLCKTDDSEIKYQMAEMFIQEIELEYGKVSQILRQKISV